MAFAEWAAPQAPCVPPDHRQESPCADQSPPWRPTVSHTQSLPCTPCQAISVALISAAYSGVTKVLLEDCPGGGCSAIYRHVCVHHACGRRHVPTPVTKSCEQGSACCTVGVHALRGDHGQGLTFKNAHWFLEVRMFLCERAHVSAFDVQVCEFLHISIVYTSVSACTSVNICVS